MISKRKFILGFVTLFCAFSMMGQDVNGAKKWTLEECVNYAWENNLTIRNSQLNLLGNEVTLKESKFAMLPNLNAGGGFGKSFGRTIDPVSNGFISRDILSSNIQASSSVTLSNGGILRNRVKQNEMNLEASGFDLEKAKNDVALNVATNFLNVLLNREQLLNAQFQLQVTAEQLDRTKKLVEAGSLPISNQLDLESQHATNEVNVVNAENNLTLSLLSLKQSMQMPAEQTLDIEIPELEVDGSRQIMENPDQIYQTALTNQPDVKSADIGIQSSELGVKIAKGSFYPSVTLRGSISSNYSDQAEQLVPGETEIVPAQPIGTVSGTGAQVLSLPRTRPVTTTDYSVWQQYDDNLGQSISLNVNIPIFSRYSNSANLQRAKIAKQRAEVTALSTRNTLRQNIETAYTNALAGKKSYEATQKRVTSLEETFRATEQQYNVGGANFTDYQVASNNLFAARRDLVRTKYQYIFRLTILDFYLGNPITVK